jgi:acyl carrier protein
MITTFESVVRILVNHLGVVSETVTMQSELKDLGADSLDVIEAMMYFEEEFGLHISDSEMRALSTVSDIVKFIDKAFSISLLQLSLSPREELPRRS